MPKPTELAKYLRKWECMDCGVDDVIEEVDEFLCAATLPELLEFLAAFTQPRAANEENT